MKWLLALPVLLVSAIVVESILADAAMLVDSGGGWTLLAYLVVPTRRSPPLARPLARTSRAPVDSRIRPPNGPLERICPQTTRQRNPANVGLSACPEEMPPA